MPDNELMILNERRKRVVARPQGPERRDAASACLAGLPEMSPRLYLLCSLSVAGYNHGHRWRSRPWAARYVGDQ